MFYFLLAGMVVRIILVKLFLLALLALSIYALLQFVTK